MEIYNDSDSPVNLRGYIFVNEYMKSGLLKSQSWTVSSDVNIPAYGYELFFFDEESGKKHATYKIETEPGVLKLFDNISRLHFILMESIGDK